MAKLLRSETYDVSSTGLQFEAAGPVVEWAVKMVRLAPAFDLEHRLERDEVDASLLTTLAKRIAKFHRQAPTNDAIARQARWKVVADNALANIDAAKKHVGQTLSEAVWQRLAQRTQQTLDDVRPLIERRAASGVPRDTHGDLRLDHVYWLPNRRPPYDWCILDGIEFNERFRFADPVADMAFLVMDLAYHGRWDLARAFGDAYFEAAADPAGRDLLPHYASYRAAVRGKVEGILREEVEVPDAERAAAAPRAKAHWLAALAWLEPAATRPQIVMIGGLPGSGKSTLARALAARTGGHVLRSDVVRKKLAGVSETATNGDHFGRGIYTDEWHEKTYRELERRAEAVLWIGGQVIVDASFREEKRRQSFLNLARRWGVPATFLQCTVPPDVAKSRLRQRRGDASDADDQVYDVAAKLWEPLSPGVARVACVVATDRAVDEAAKIALSAGAK
jgi:aminoglycoside phosphotransferase family enzyme/predicted kinase